METRKVAIVGGARIPFCRSGTGYKDVGNFELMTTALKGLVDKFGLKGQRLGDVSLGAVLNQSSDFNLARETVMEAGLAWETPGFNIQRACGTGLESAILIGNKIALGQIDSGIGGGTDTNSDPPIVYQQRFARLIVQAQRAKSLGERLKILASLRPSDFSWVLPGIIEPRTKLSMGQHCERMAQTWGITREDQDKLAFESHKRGAAAYERGFYKDLVVPAFGVSKDNNLRADTSLEKLAKLKPAFDFTGKGTLTAGNSTPLTDGAACTLLASEEWAKERGLPVEAYLVTGEVAAVNFPAGEGLLMAPAFAVARMLKRLGLSLQDFDFYEIHEAFAAQVLCTLKAWESEKFCKEQLGLEKALGSIDRSKLNVVGGSVALGHPFAATGARIVPTLSRLLKEKGRGRGLISVCTAGGMGVTAVLER